MECTANPIDAYLALRKEKLALRASGTNPARLAKIERELEGANVYPMDCFLAKRRQVFEENKTSTFFGRPVANSGVVAQKMETFCSEYGWDYEGMQEKFEDWMSDGVG